MGPVNRGVDLSRGGCPQGGDQGPVDRRARWQILTGQGSEVYAQTGQGGDGVIVGGRQRGHE